MGIYDTSYPPSVLMLGSSHDLKLVGTPVPGTLDVGFTWDSDGRSATIDFGDGSATVTNATETVDHTYATHDIYEPRVTSGRASDSATLDLTMAGRSSEPETEQDEPAQFIAIPVDEIPSD